MLTQMVAQQSKMLRLLGGHLQPVQVELARHVRKAPDGIQRQIDGVELNVCNGMHQHGPPLQGGGRTPGHLRVRPQHRPGRVAGQGGMAVQHRLRRNRIVVCLGQHGHGGLGFFLRIAQAQNLQGMMSKLHTCDCR